MEKNYYRIPRQILSKCREKEKTEMVRTRHAPKHIVNDHHMEMLKGAEEKEVISKDERIATLSTTKRKVEYRTAC